MHDIDGSRYAATHNYASVQNGLHCVDQVNQQRTYFLKGGLCRGCYSVKQQTNNVIYQRRVSLSMR